MTEATGKTRRSYHTPDNSSSVSCELVELARLVDLALNVSTWYPRRSRIASALLLGSCHTQTRVSNLFKFIASSGLTPEHYIDMAITYVVSVSGMFSQLSFSRLATQEVYDALKEQRYKTIYGFHSGEDTSLSSQDSPDAVSESVLKSLRQIQTLIDIWGEEGIFGVLIAKRNTIDPAVLYAVPEIQRGIDLEWVKLEDYTAAEVRTRFKLANSHPNLKDNMQWNWIKSFSVK